MIVAARPLLLMAWLVCLAALAPTAWAAPEVVPADPVMQLLMDRGLTTPPATPSSISAQSTPATTGIRQSAAQMVDSAMGFLGVRYVRGGNSADSGFDCSGFTRFIFEHSVGLMLPRRADEQAHAPGLQKVSRESLIPGDLVFFNTLRRTFSHVGIYIGDGKFIHSPRRGGHVRVEDMRIKYWDKRFTGARRADLPTSGDAAPAPSASPDARVAPVGDIPGMPPLR